jgi:hypothetical protein
LEDDRHCPLLLRDLWRPSFSTADCCLDCRETWLFSSSDVFLEATECLE